MGGERELKRVAFRCQQRLNHVRTILRPTQASTIAPELRRSRARIVESGDRFDHLALDPFKAQTTLPPCRRFALDTTTRFIVASAFA